MLIAAFKEPHKSSASFKLYENIPVEGRTRPPRLKDYIIILKIATFIKK